MTTQGVRHPRRLRSPGTSAGRVERSWFDERELRLAFTVAAAAAAVGLSVALHADRLTTFVVTAVVLAVTARGCGAVLGLLAGVASWALYTGFGENTFGTLTLAGDDVYRALVLAAIGIAAGIAPRMTSRSRTADGASGQAARRG